MTLTNKNARADATTRIGRFLGQTKDRTTKFFTCLSRSPRMGPPLNRHSETYLSYLAKFEAYLKPMVLSVSYQSDFYIPFGLNLKSEQAKLLLKSF